MKISFILFATAAKQRVKDLLIILWHFLVRTADKQTHTLIEMGADSRRNSFVEVVKVKLHRASHYSRTSC